MNKLKTKTKAISKQCKKGVNAFNIKELFELDVTKLNSFKIGISSNLDGGIWWSSEAKQDYYNQNMQLYGYCNFFSSDQHGWTTPEYKKLDNYFAFNFERLIIHTISALTVKIFLLYKEK